MKLLTIRLGYHKDDSQVAGYDETIHHSAMPPKYRGQAAGYSTVKSHRLSAAHRLLREDGFDRVIQAENIADKHFKIYFAHNYKGYARLGIISSKKVFPRAVDRNRIKRVIREAFRQHSIKAKQLDIVVIVRHVPSQAPDVRGNNLKIMLSHVENRCAEL